MKFLSFSPWDGGARRSILLLALAILALAGCATQRFVADYYLDPRPPRTSYSDLATPTNPQPVYLVFDMYSAQGSFPEATQKIGPKIVHVLKSSGLSAGRLVIGGEKGLSARHPHRGGQQPAAGRGSADDRRPRRGHHGRTSRAQLPPRPPSRAQAVRVGRALRARRQGSTSRQFRQLGNDVNRFIGDGRGAAEAKAPVLGRPIRCAAASAETSEHLFPVIPALSLGANSPKKIFTL